MDLPWENRWLQGLPADPESGNYPRQVSGITHSYVSPAAVKSPRLIGWSEALAEQLNIARPEALDLALLAGNGGPASLQPYAAVYGGHQFGQWAGQLGDGRAITLGDVNFAGVGRLEFQLKGAGPTPYSRRGDGRAVLRSSLREYLCSEAMHHLRVPTTRALSLVTTGEEVMRDMFYDGRAAPEPGAIVCRVAPSFLRFGNFEILTARGDTALLKRLTDFLLTEHYPEFLLSNKDPYAQLLDEIARRTARLTVEWARVGFVHGVLNTDNMSALGLTLDYGPYGWLEPFDPEWTPNTTDASTRRYRFGQQAAVALWNLARLAEAWFPLIAEEARLYRSLEIFRETHLAAEQNMQWDKLGLSTPEARTDLSLFTDLTSLLASDGDEETDYTVFFRTLSETPPPIAAAAFARWLSPARYAKPPLAPERWARWEPWLKRYHAALAQDARPPTERRAAMGRANPKYVLRNWLAQNAITAATAGDLAPLQRLERVLQNPYTEQPGNDDLAARRPEWARHAPGCSALSCSS